MRTVVYECKKAFTSPIFIVLIVLFTAYNIYLILNQSYFKEELKVVNEIAKNYGVEITDESLQRLEQDIHKEMDVFNEIVKKHTNERFSSVNDFFQTLRYEDYELYSEEEQAFLNELQLKEMYLNLAKSIDSEYDQLDWAEIAKNEIYKFQLSESAAKILVSEYEKLADRFEELKEYGEHQTWFFAGNPYRMHSFLFRTVFGHIIFEALILIVLSTALIANYEFENKTHLVTYATKKGRNLAKDKFIAALITAGLITVFLIGITFIVYFSIFDYSYLWKSSVNSALNWEYILPYVSWWNVTYVEFILWSIVLIFICLLLFASITFVLSTFLKNSYFTFFLFAAFFAISILLPKFMPKTSMLIFYAGFNLPQLVLNPHMFFMGNSGLSMFRNYEMVTVGVTFVLANMVSLYSFRRFNKQDIH